MNIRTLLLFCNLIVMIQDGFAADEIHWTVTWQDSITFDWKGTSAEKTIAYGTSPGVYTNGICTNAFTKNASNPTSLPTSSSGPFWEAKITSLQEDTLYYYSIVNDPEPTFRTSDSSQANLNNKNKSRL